MALMGLPPALEVAHPCRQRQIVSDWAFKIQKNAPAIIDGCVFAWVVYLSVVLCRLISASLVECLHHSIHIKFCGFLAWGILF